MERGMLLLPDSKTGKKAIVLNAPALQVLAHLPRIGAYVIAGQNAGTKDDGPRADLKRPWQAIAKTAKLSGVRIHDLRHTHASVGAGAGLGLPIIGKLLGHAHATTTARYAHLDADPLRKASEHIGHHLAAAMGDTPQRQAAEIVSLSSRKRGSCTIGAWRLCCWCRNNFQTIALSLGSQPQLVFSLGERQRR